MNTFAKRFTGSILITRVVANSFISIVATSVISSMDRDSDRQLISILIPQGQGSGIYFVLWSHNPAQLTFGHWILLRPLLLSSLCFFVLVCLCHFLLLYICYQQDSTVAESQPSLLLHLNIF